MPLFIMALLLGLFIHEARPVPADVMPAWKLALAMALPRVTLGAMLLAVTRWTRRRLDAPSTSGPMRRLDRAEWLYRVAGLALYGIEMRRLFVLDRLRETIGDTVLIDEILALTPSLALMVWGWWCHYPIDRRLREFADARRQREGLPPHPIWTRGQYVVAQARVQMLVFLVPALLALGWHEGVARLAARFPHGLDERAADALVYAGIAGVVVTTPWLIRLLWDTAPLPDGEVRSRVVELCGAYRIRVRGLLLWRTHGGMANAAVVGIIPAIRYILFSDALLESMPARQVEAVMAHELAHIRKRHIFWLLGVTFASFELLSELWYRVAVAAARAIPRRWLEAMDISALSAEIAGGGGGSPEERLPATLWLAASLATIVTWIMVFGWVSRRYERQADTFAAQHLSRTSAGAGEPGHVITADSIETVCGALQTVADLNHVSTSRRALRHGSIAWRQAYLRTLVGTPLERAAIDRVVDRINIAATLSLVVIAAWRLAERWQMLMP